MSKKIKSIGSSDAATMMHDNLIVKHYAGSYAYGTNIATSDVDFRGIFYADPVNIRTPFFPVREVTDMAEEDTKSYELTHFMKLCLDCNPNIIETLWVDEEDVIFKTPMYELLRKCREKLLSRKIAFTTSGYAIAQLKRIKGHNKWINNPQPNDCPVPSSFLSIVQWFPQKKTPLLRFIDLYFNGKTKTFIHTELKSVRDNHRLIPYGRNIYGVVPSIGSRLWNDSGNLNDTFEDERMNLPPPIMIIKWNKEVYNTAKDTWKNYWTWKNNRNATRSDLEQHFGYDSKHAMHLVRLMRIGQEALTEGKIIVKRPDAEELLSIRNGALTYDELIKYAEDMDSAIRGKLYNNSILPKKPDIKFAAGLLMAVQNECWRT